MKYLLSLLRVLRLVKKSQIGYGVAMKFVDRIKHRIQLVVTMVIIWALIVIALLVYIAVQVS
jgi:hypothetical protein